MMFGRIRANAMTARAGVRMAVASDMSDGSSPCGFPLPMRNLACIPFSPAVPKAWPGGADGRLGGMVAAA